MTITLFGNTSITSMRPSTDPSAISNFGTGYAGFSHRLSYTLQAMMAVKATDWLSIQLSPTFVWRNKVAYNDNNGLFFPRTFCPHQVCQALWNYFRIFSSVD